MPPAGDPEGEGPGTWRPNPKRVARGPRAGRPEHGVEQIPEGPSWWERIVFGRVGTGQLAAFCRQFAAYLDAGVDILKALSSLEKQFARTALGPVTGRILTGVRRGDSLTAAVEREPGAFDSLFVSMIRVAEARGGVPETLKRLSRHYENRQTLIRQARSAMIYPISVLIIAGGVIALLTIFVLPTLIELLKGLNKPGMVLPLPSRMLMAFSAFVGSMGWWLLPAILVGVPVLLLRVYKTRPGKVLMDEFALLTPVLGMFLRKLETTRFARTLAALLGAGVDIGASIDLTAGVMQLEPFRRLVKATRVQVMDGQELSEALGSTHRFGFDVIAVIQSGEETGKLPESLERLADDYEEQVAHMVKNLGQLVQPVIMILLGGFVLFIILAVFLPYLAALTNLAGA